MILIGWVLLGLFRRKPTEEPTKPNQRQRQGQNPKQETHPANPKPTAFPVEFPWEKVEELLDPKPKPQPTRVEKLEIKREEAPQKKHSARERATDSIRQPHPSEINHEAHSSARKPASALPPGLVDFKRVESTNVMQGVIWSQVLGSPRAKEPHRSNRAMIGRRR